MTCTERGLGVPPGHLKLILTRNQAERELWGDEHCLIFPFLG